MLSWQAPSRRQALRFSLMWGALALTCFVIAGILTAMVLELSHLDVLPRPLQLSVSVPPRASSIRTPRIEYTQYSDKGRVRIFDLPLTGYVYISPLLSTSSCEDGQHKPVNQEQTNFGLPPAPLERLTLHGAGSEFIICYTQPLIVSESYVGRRFDAANEVMKGDRGRSLAWVLDLSNISNTDNLRFNSGLLGQRPETERLVPVDDWVVSRWDDRQAASSRDVLLVVIGAMIALGATTLLEALRPFVDILSARGEVPR